MVVQHFFEKVKGGAWKDGQQAAVTSVVGGTDTVFIAPTGGGKTLVAIVAGLVLMDDVKHATTLVIAPTVALSEQHVTTINTTVGPLSAVFFQGSKSSVDVQTLVLERTPPFVVLSPEALPNLYAALRNRGRRITLIVVDEAHCVFEWGTEDFRKAYTNSFVRVRHAHTVGAPMPPILGLTATLRREDEQMLLTKLCMSPTNRVIHRFRVSHQCNNSRLAQSGH